MTIYRGKVPVNGQGLSGHDLVVYVAESRLAKKHVFCSEGMVDWTGRKTLACASEVIVE